MLTARVLPCLLLKGEALVKTVRFNEVNYIGDAINTVRIFNQMEVDELVFLDITATTEGRRPNFKLIEEIASESFMPFGYGGGINDLDDIKTILSIGVEKVIINSYAFENPAFIQEAAQLVGSQSIVISIDVKKRFWGKYEVLTHGGRQKTGANPVEYARRMEQLGAGELFLTAIDRDGTWDGYDLELIRQVTKAVSVPVIASGGAGSVADFGAAVKKGGASAVAAGSMFIYQGKGLGVLVSYPSRTELINALS